MTTKTPSKKWLLRRDEWVRRINTLADEVAQWAEAEGWPVLRKEKHVKEQRVGEYDAPVLRIRSLEGEVFLTPIALDVMGADGRVDLEAWPTLHRVRLVPEAQSWKIITDSNVPIREPWTRETFVRLVHDLQN
jgi:hypothetical protein